MQYYQNKIINVCIFASLHTYNVVLKIFNIAFIYFENILIFQFANCLTLSFYRCQMLISKH